MAGSAGMVPVPVPESTAVMMDTGFVRAAWALENAGAPASVGSASASACAVGHTALARSRSHGTVDTRHSRRTPYRQEAALSSQAVAC